MNSDRVLIEQILLGDRITENEEQIIFDIIPELKEEKGFAQNNPWHIYDVWNHTKKVFENSKADEEIRMALLLHDIGKAIDFEMEGSHVEIGMDLAKKYNENKIVINAIGSHHGDIPATSVISSIVNIADTISASRPGARNDSSENYFQRLEKIEEIGNEVKGVDKAYAIQAGRELRVIVKPEEIDDLTSYKIARDIKQKIEDELQYPGTIKITVIRETRAIEEAK